MGADKSAKKPQMPQNLSAPIAYPSPKVWDFDEKRLHWASVVRGCPFNILQLMMTRLENQSIFEGHRAFICK